ncbi:MAG TPA: cytochrome c oxidase subunit 3 [Rhodopila sp.]|nr:cytochrome c oxidase subunit 3 [Rhodopila sp.]
MDIDLHGDHGPGAAVIKQPYHLPDPSPWPLMGSIGGFLTVFGIILAAHFGNYVVLVLGVLTILATMAFWWRDVLREGRIPGAHSAIVRLGLRYGMTLFIASEVMFFVGFFWAYFNFLLFPDTQGNGQTVWPPSTIHTFDPFHLPLLNTMILLLSGTTVTWAHHSLLENDRKGLIRGLGLTILLGISFTICQAIEYSHAPFKFVGGGVYPSTFFLATGFHGFHVIVGTCFLTVCWFRARNNQFTPERHFGFEAAAWYWHFVDVVWLFLFACIYWYGAGNIAVE